MSALRQEIKSKRSSIHPLFLFLGISVVEPTLAETITIGKGKGIQWEGMPFSVTMSGRLDDSRLEARFGLASISSQRGACQVQNHLTVINGMQVHKIADGVGLIPRAIGTASYTLFDGTVETLGGTLGLPESKGQTSSGMTIVNPVWTSGDLYGRRVWCLPPRTTTVPNFYSASGDRTSTVTGTWVLITDGTQKSQDGIRLPAMWASSLSYRVSGDRTHNILPDTVDLRISNLECSVNTPTAINFGAVLRDLTPDAELSRITNQFNITCGQDTDKINANINVQFRAITGLYKGAPSRLSLKQDGGYITGEIPGITADASCGGTGGVTFDNTQLKIGEITSSEEKKTFTNQIAWRLCSGGADLPVGKVDAAAELLVTYN